MVSHSKYRPTPWWPSRCTLSLSLTPSPKPDPYALPLSLSLKPTPHQPSNPTPHQVAIKLHAKAGTFVKELKFLRLLRSEYVVPQP